MKTYYILINGEETSHQIPELDLLHDRVLEEQTDELCLEFDQEIEKRFGSGAITVGTVKE